MKERKLNYRFHNPNDERETIDYILSVFMEVNTERLDEIVKESVKESVEKN